jgi:hypothetical protein
MGYLDEGGGRVVERGRGQEIEEGELLGGWLSPWQGEG